MDLTTPMDIGSLRRKQRENLATSATTFLPYLLPRVPLAGILVLRTSECTADAGHCSACGKREAHTCWLSSKVQGNGKSHSQGNGKSSCKRATFGGEQAKGAVRILEWHRGELQGRDLFGTLFHPNRSTSSLF